MQTANNEIGTIVRGDCDLCGHWSGNLINGTCAYCDDRDAADHIPGDIVDLDRQPPPIIETASGRVVDLVDPDPATISIGDIAHHLARVNRYNGATSGPRGLSVAQHSVWVAMYLEVSTQHHHAAPDPVLVMCGLLHDAAEAYLGDVTSPLKHVPGIVDEYKRLESHMQHVIAQALHVPKPGPERRIEIRHADEMALAVEADVLIESRGCGAVWPDLPAVDHIARMVNDRGYSPGQLLEPTMAEAVFEQCFINLQARMPEAS